MALALKRVHNLPPYLSYVSKLPDITQKPKRDSDELKQRLTDTWGPYSSEAVYSADAEADFVYSADFM